MTYRLDPDDFNDGGILRLVADALLDPGDKRPSTWPSHDDLARIRERLHHIADMVDLELTA